MTLAKRLRANLDLALAHHRCNELRMAAAEHRDAGPALTITTLAPLAGSTRSTLAGLGGHTRISTLQGVAGALGCTVANLVEGVEPTTPVEPGQPLGQFPDPMRFEETFDELRDRLRREALDED